MISLTTYAYMMRMHNWHWQRSDDHRAYHAGRVAQARIDRHGSDSEDHADLHYRALRKFQLFKGAHRGNR